ncbi:hypothetical protein ACH40E_44080, partial [Streptomyces acidicola]
MQGDLGALAEPVLGLVAVGHRLQPLALRGGQSDRAGGGNGQGRKVDREKWITTGRILPHPDGRLSGRTSAVRTPSEHTRLQLELYLNMHTKTAWPQLAALRIRHRGQLAYVEGALADGGSVKLMRLRYRGTANRWGFALHDADSDRYQDALLPTGSGSGTRRGCYVVSSRLSEFFDVAESVPVGALKDLEDLA